MRTIRPDVSEIVKAEAAWGQVPVPIVACLGEHTKSAFLNQCQLEIVKTQN